MHCRYAASLNFEHPNVQSVGVGQRQSSSLYTQHTTKFSHFLPTRMCRVYTNHDNYFNTRRIVRYYMYIDFEVLFPLLTVKQMPNRG